MTDAAHDIDLNLADKLKDRAYRRKFFMAETSALIAEQLISLRKRRGLDQKELAVIVGTKQPAISRVEQSQYQNWSFNTLRKIADALDARIRVVIEPAEDVLGEYATPKAQATAPVMRIVVSNQTSSTIAAYEPELRSGSEYLCNSAIGYFVPATPTYLTNGTGAAQSGWLNISGLSGRVFTNDLTDQPRDNAAAALSSLGAWNANQALTGRYVLPKSDLALLPYWRVPSP